MSLMFLLEVKCSVSDDGEFMNVIIGLCHDFTPHWALS